MKHIRKILIIVLMVSFIFILSSCGKKNDAANFKFKYWNDCAAIDSLTEYVKDVTNEKSENYIPKEDRIATFDMDGTLFGELFPAYFEYLLFAHRVLDDSSCTNKTEVMIETATWIRENKYTWNMKQTGLELRHANGQAKAFAGLSIKEFEDYVKDFANTDAEGFNNLKYKDAIYLPMVEVVNYLQLNDFITYIVSGSDRFICRAIASEAFNIPYNQIIGMDVKLVSNNQGDTDGLNYLYTLDDTVIRTDELVIKNLKMNKVYLITQEIGKQPVLAFGNSSGDSSMLNYAMSNPNYKGMGYMLIADDIDRDYPNLEETEKRRVSFESSGYTIISMKDDFKTIYGENVTKKIGNN